MRFLPAILLAACTLGPAQPPAIDSPATVLIPAAEGNPSAFRIAATEVSVAQFERFAAATGFKTRAEEEGSSRTWRNPGFELDPRQPVTYVSALDANAYCRWAGGRLPTDEEWIYAARAGSTTRHYWGEEIDPEYLWFRENSEDRPQPVGTKRPNAFGLYDVQGNVWEWTLPREPVHGETLANRRGGSWVSCAESQAAPGHKPSPLLGIDRHYRVPVKLNHRYDDIGFRCVFPE